MTSAGRSWLMLLLPGAAVLAVAAVLLHTSLLPGSATPLLDAYPYVILLAGIALSWRFHSSRALFGVLVLALAARALAIAPDHRATGFALFASIALLLPVNLAVLSFTRERGIISSDNGFRLAILALQALIVALLCRPELAGLASLLERLWDNLRFTRLPAVDQFAFLAAASILLLRLLLYRQPLDAAFFWALLASFFGLQFSPTIRVAEAWLATGGFIVAGSVIETSYRMAYHDELTALPGRRAFNEALVRLGDRWALALVDVDHFKRFNDTYGHDVGDHVLRMVAARLARVTGGGQAFRCGGEEFAVIFPKSFAEEALPHLEDLRAAIEETSFTVRGRDRRSGPREGAERRAPERAKARESAVQAKLTVSIGVAEPSARLHTAEQVVRAADKALYRAKAMGRNRLELAGSRPAATASGRRPLTVSRRPTS